MTARIAFGTMLFALVVWSAAGIAISTIEECERIECLR